ncbi:retropepsin-like aspartic protease [Chitinophaga sp. sic0106]|uniref:retropepsin-like aspartic protease n=1 Tax=Chitinophaga sp. sic0106 TaxID=2854785 RepID=UPI001C4754B8|nr:retropepsin-like aspartic protease [Chitinophaga sp. sic0106]MBV7532455.1 retropepsin-like domain-containing protein [Chitinophaga sp. sic0106]
MPIFTPNKLSLLFSLLFLVFMQAQSIAQAPASRQQTDTVPFTLKGSRIYIQGTLNGAMQVSMQFDLGAGGSAVNKASSERLNLNFEDKAMLSNTQGINEVRKSTNNQLTFGNLTFSHLPLVESGNMKPGEDLIIGNYLFRNKIVEIDYDKQILLIRDALPDYAASYQKQPVVFEQDRPKFEVTIIQDGKTYTSWFLFDTGRDGTMLLGEDFTGQGDTWNNLKELTILNGRKIIQLDATIAGVVFKDILTNAADPTKQAPRKTTTLFGNVLLNHFNVILDNQAHLIYLKPNSRINEPYSHIRDYEKEMQKIKK